MVPVVLVFDRDVAFEILGFQFVEYRADLRDAGPIDDIGTAFANGCPFLQMGADDTTLEDPEAVEWLEARGGPMAGVSTGANSRIAILHQLEDVIRVPHFVIWIIAFGMLVKPDADVVLFDHF